MKKCFDITRLLCLSVLLSVFCFSSVLAAARMILICQLF